MKTKGFILGLGMMAGLTLFTISSSQVFASEDEWTDYDPCGWSVMGQESVAPGLAVVSEDEWTDYDPCGWNVEQESVKPGLAVVSDDEWTDYDPCGWNVEQESVKPELASALDADDEENNFVN